MVSWVNLSTIREMVEELICREVHFVSYLGRIEDRTHKQRSSQIEIGVLCEEVRGGEQGCGEAKGGV